MFLQGNSRLGDRDFEIYPPYLQVQFIRRALTEGLGIRADMFYTPEVFTMIGINQRTGWTYDMDHIFYASDYDFLQEKGKSVVFYCFGTLMQICEMSLIDI